MSKPTIDEIQTHHKRWADDNFHPVQHNLDPRVLQTALGACEEAGELAHAVLKADQGIRYTEQEAHELMRDSVGDIILYLMDFCSCHGWDLSEIIRETSDHVHGRDWQNDPMNAGDKTDG